MSIDNYLSDLLINPEKPIKIYYTKKIIEEKTLSSINYKDVVYFLIVDYGDNIITEEYISEDISKENVRYFCEKHNIKFESSIQI